MSSGDLDFDFGDDLFSSDDDFDFDDDFGFSDSDDSAEAVADVAASLTVPESPLSDAIRTELEAFDREFTTIARDEVAITPGIIRLMVLDALGKTRDPAIRPALRPLLTHPDKQVLEAAVRALANTGDRTVSGRLLELLRESESDFDSETVQALLHLDDPTMTPDLIAYLKAKRRSSRINEMIMDRFGVWGDYETIPLLKEYADTSSRVRLRDDRSDKVAQAALRRIAAKVIGELKSESTAFQWYATSNLIPFDETREILPEAPQHPSPPPGVSASTLVELDSAAPTEDDYDSWVSSLSQFTAPESPPSPPLPTGANWIDWGNAPSAPKPPTAPLNSSFATVSSIVREGINLVKAGHKDEAKALLLRAVELDQFNEEAWLWLSGLVDGIDDQITCLENVLAINPKNERARMGLDYLAKQRPPVKPLHNDTPFGSGGFGAGTFNTPRPSQFATNPFGKPARGPFGDLDDDDPFSLPKNDVAPSELMYREAFDKLNAHPIRDSATFQRLLDIGDHGVTETLKALKNAPLGTTFSSLSSDADEFSFKDDLFEVASADAGTETYADTVEWAIVLVLVLAEQGALTRADVALVALKFPADGVRFAAAVILHFANWKVPVSMRRSNSTEVLTQKDFDDALTVRRIKPPGRQIDDVSAD